MNENESGLKRPQESAFITENDEHKKQKTNSNDEAAASQQQQQEDMSLLPTTLVLDKAQEDTINDLVNNSNAAASLLQQSTTDVTDEQQKLVESDNPTTDMIIESEIPPPPSADSTKAAVTGTENEKAVEDASITSEQLLFALTSIPSASEKEAEEQQQKKTTKDVEQPIVEADHAASNDPSPPQAAAAAALPPMPSLPPAGLGITPKTTPPPSGLPSDPVVPSSTSHVPEAVPTAPVALPPPPPPPPPTTTTTTTSLASTATNTSTIPSLHKSNINTTPTNPTLSSGASAAAAAVAASFSNFPEISAALRRLSTTNPGVIEQLSSSAASSSSPRLPSNMSDRKGSSIDVSPHEIFGNALAAVAANAAAARSSPHHPNMASPKQQQQQPNPLSTTSTNNNNNNNAQATATAIGNLAAFTANISNLLHSGGFHRNSFSQEDTQKLAAVVANARNPQQRRKSSMQVVGNAFSSMIDQAYLMGRNKSFSEAAAAATANRSVPPTSSNYLPSANTLSQPHPAPPPPPVVPKPKLIIKNEQVWKSVEGMEEKSLGFQLYSPQLLLPNLEGSVNGLMEIRVPARFLTFENVKVKKRALWGTDIYTDDSDIVAMAIHSGKYQPHFIEPTIEPTDPFALAVAGKQKESMEAARRLALSGKKYTQHNQHWIPDHDLKVTVRVLPTLQSYASSIRHRLRSREWGKHDGMSLFVNKVEKVKRGDARLKGRSTLKSNMFAYESYRKQALGLHQDKKTIPTSSNTPSSSTSSTSSSSSSSSLPIHKGRIKKTRRVMRMFQIRSEMKKQA